MGAAVAWLVFEQADEGRVGRGNPFSHRDGDGKICLGGDGSGGGAEESVFGVWGPERVKGGGSRRARLGVAGGLRPGFGFRPDFFELLGLSSVRGETMDGDTPDGAVWLARSLWESAFGSDASVLGQMIQLDGSAYRIAGIASRAAEEAVEDVAVFARIGRSELLASPSDEAARGGERGCCLGSIEGRSERCSSGAALVPARNAVSRKREFAVSRKQ